MAKRNRKRNRGNFWLKSSDMVLDMAKLLFGGGIVGAWFQDIPNRMHYAIMVSEFLAILILLGYVLYGIGNNQNKE